MTFLNVKNKTIAFVVISGSLLYFLLGYRSNLWNEYKKWVDAKFWRATCYLITSEIYSETTEHIPFDSFKSY